MKTSLVINNFDGNPKLHEVTPDGKKRFEVRKRINGVSVVGLIEAKKNSVAVCTSWTIVDSPKTSAGSMPENSSRRPNVQDATDSLANVRKKIDEIRTSAKKSSKIVDENGEPLGFVQRIN